LNSPLTEIGFVDKIPGWAIKYTRIRDSKLEFHTEFFDHMNMLVLSAWFDHKKAWHNVPNNFLLKLRRDIDWFLDLETKLRKMNLSNAP
jgi:hypothetical protein